MRLTHPLPPTHTRLRTLAAARRAATLVSLSPPPLGAAAATVIAPQTALAQGLRGVLRSIDRATRPDSGAARPAASGTGVASGGALRVVDQQVTGSDSLAQRFAGDTGVTIARTSGACGVARACVPGWDLRVMRVTLPGPLVPTGAQVIVTTEIENRGRQPAPPSELRLCFGETKVFGVQQGSGCGRRMLDAVAVPGLAAGERVRVRHAVALPTNDHEAEGWTIAAEVDPDGTLGERDRSNNVARSAPTSSRLATLQFLSADATADGRVGAALPVTVSIRNTSTVSTSTATELQLEGYGGCTATGNWGGGPNRVAVPALAPRQTVTYHLLVPDAVRCRASQASMTLRLDPDRRGHWGQGNESDVRRSYTVR